MRIWGCFWGPHTFLVGGYQDGLHSAYPDLTPGLPNLNRETNPQPLLLLGLDLGSEPQNIKMEMATERSETPAPCRSPCPGWRWHGMPAGSPC